MVIKPMIFCFMNTSFKSSEDWTRAFDGLDMGSFENQGESESERELHCEHNLMEARH